MDEKMIIKPEYISQRDNIDREGDPDPNTQCFISTPVMWFRWAQLAYDIRPNALLDEIAYREVLFNNLKSNETRYDWSIHQRCLNTLLKENGFPIRLKMASANVPAVAEQIENGFPTIMSMWGEYFKKSVKGHIWLPFKVFRDKENKVSLGGHDPFGDARTGWKDTNGEDIVYDWQDLVHMLENERKYFKVIEEK